MDQPKIERVLRLMKLLTGNMDYSIDEIAEKLETSPRSIYRYLDTFKEAGFAVRKSGNYYSLGKESKFFDDISQLIHFTDEEAYIVNSLIDNLDDTNLLKQNLRKKLASIYDCTALADCVVKGKQAVNVHNVIAAIENHKQAVLCNYASSNSGAIRDRLVEPFAFTTNYVQIWCYDLESKTNKLFKTARIDSVNVLEQEWTAEDKHHQGFIDIFRFSSYEQLPIKLKLGVKSHNLLIEEFPLSEKFITPAAHSTWKLDATVCDYMGVTRFYVGLSDDIEIIGPQALKDYVKQYIQKKLLPKTI